MTCVFGVTTCVASPLPPWTPLGCRSQKRTIHSAAEWFLGDWISYSHPAFVWNPAVGKALYSDLMKTFSASCSYAKIHAKGQSEN